MSRTDPTGPDVRIGHRFQGPTGNGQGGWTAHRFASLIEVPVDVSIRAPIPLDTDLRVEPDETGGAWRLVVGPPAPEPRQVVMTASTRPALAVATTPVSIGDASAARDRFASVVDEHPVPECFSCGVRSHSMRVHAGPLGDGTDRWATDWTPPAWAAEGAAVDEGVVWAALDCTAAWYVGRSRGARTAFTVRYATDVLRPLRVGDRYALVAWQGDGVADWDGRKRYAASAAFDSDGTCVARSTSLWVSVD